MSSMYNQYSGVAQSHEDLDLDCPMPGTNSNHLSPFNHSHTLSTSASPSRNIESTPGESLSEYSNYQSSELSDLEDPFFGVNFDAGVSRVDSIPTAAILGNVAYRSADLDRPLPPLPRDTKSLSATTTTTTTSSVYPLSPLHSSKTSTPSPQRILHEPVATISPQELISGPQYSQPSSLSSATATTPAALQLTPDHSDSSHTSREDLEPSTATHLEHSSFPTVSSSDASSESQPDQFNVRYSSTNNPSLMDVHQDHPLNSSGHTGIFRGEDGSWRLDNATGQAGLDPEARRELAETEVPTLKEQGRRRQISHKNNEVDSWRAQAEESETLDNAPNHHSLHLRRAGEQTIFQSRDAEHDGIKPLDDTVSIHENRFVDGQVYFDTDATSINGTDIELMSQPRQWNDAPVVPYITDTQNQPGTSQDAIQKFIRHADAISVASRAATWGTRRRSEPSLKDFQGVTDGSFLKKLSIKSSERPRQPSLFDGLASIVRNRSDSKLKRMRSTHNIPEDLETPSHPRQGSQGSLAPPSRMPSLGKKHVSSPTITTASAFAAMAGSLAAVGTTHTRSGSVSAVNTSPKSPGHLGFTSVFNRSRSKSDVSGPSKEPNTALVGLWRGQGGPPVARLASQKRSVEMRRPEAQIQDDADDEDEEDEEPADEADMAESDQVLLPIKPDYEGFKEHIRRLNPDMESQYSWLVSRVARQQELRYKSLLELRVKHHQAIRGHTCASGEYCLSSNGQATPGVVGNRQRNNSNSQEATGGLHLVTDFSDGSDPGEGALTDETFPQGVPMPPTRNLPDQFECQLCFKVKRFQKPSDWTKHVHEDVQPFTCTYEKCKESKSFKRKADWVRHENERHRHLEWWVCQIEDCRHVCYRKDNFLQHLVREHKLPEPKQKTKAAIKKAHSAEPAWEMLEKCHDETKKKPQDEPCKLCGKTFPTWKKLTVHLAKHMEHISLPVLRLVESKVVDANTIISPIETLITPVTPLGQPKLESPGPFEMDHISPHIHVGNNFATAGFDQPTYLDTTSPQVSYGLQAQAQSNYQVNDMYARTFPNMNQPRMFQPLDSSTMGHMGQQAPGFGMIHQPYQPKFEQQPYEPLHPSFPLMQNQQNFGSDQRSPYSVPQPYSAAPPVSNFQAPNILGINGVGYGLEPIPAQDNRGYQQVPMNRARGSGSSYGHSPQPNGQFYQ